MEKIKKNLFSIILISLCLIALILGTFFDLQISSKISVLQMGEYYSKHIPLVLTEIFGEIVLYVLLSFSFIIIYLSNGESIVANKIGRLIIKISSAFLCYAFNVFATYKVSANLFDHYYFSFVSNTLLMTLYYFLAGVVFFGFYYLICVKIDKKIIKCLAIWSLIVVFTAGLSQGIVHGVKPIFARVRFRTLNYFNDFSFYNKWFRLNNLTAKQKVFIKQVIGSDGYKSFPSGHTACASIMFSICSLKNFFKRFSFVKWKILLNSIAVFYSLFIAYSRIAIGAHYLTDVVVALLITYLSFLLFNYIVCKYFTKNLNSNLVLKEVELTE